MGPPIVRPPKHNHFDLSNETPKAGAHYQRARGGLGLSRFTHSTAARVGLLLLAIVALSVAAYLVLGRTSGPVSRQAESASSHPPGNASQSTPAAEDQSQESIIAQIFGSDRSSSSERPAGLLLQVTRMAFRLLLASLLAAMLAFRPHKYTPVFHRNPYVAQTQILLAVVASALMMIVADNAARAFGIFAAASLVRFRTNIRDPKEITVLLINLAIGLATGVGRWELAVILSVFVLATLWLLEYYESRQLIRSMQLKVKTHNVAETDEALQKVFGWHKLTAEVREVDREDDEHPLGRIVYRVAVGPRLSTDLLSEEIFSSDPHNIDTVEWHQKKSVSYTYR